MNLNPITTRLLNGDISPLTVTNIISINNEVINLKDKPVLTEVELDQLHEILFISNIIFNNTDREIQVLDNEIYDSLIEKYMSFRPNDATLVGAPPVKFENFVENFTEAQQVVEPITFADDTDRLYVKDIMKNSPLVLKQICVNPITFDEYKEVSKRITDTAHNYPALVGTLSKNKFVLNKQAQDQGVFDDANVQIFERDFLGKHIRFGIIKTSDHIVILLSLKYDGVSVEGDIRGSYLVGARSRGDTANDVASDLTPILEGYHFYRADGFIPEDYEFGMKFEAIMTFENLKIFNELTGSVYKNGRTAISGLFGRKDAYKYRDLITLVPLATSLDNVDRITEVEFMNKYYSTDVAFKYVVIEGTYIDILFKVKTFVDEAEYCREYLNFMYDGVVAEYVDEYLINTLGRKNSINQYAIAIKFNPLKKTAYVTGIFVTIGKDGTSTPMITYTPVEFIGTTHTKSSLHSYARFIEERPAIGKISDVVYVNDVMPYVTIPNNSYNEGITDLLEYPDTCPSCGSKLLPKESGKNWYCPNIRCNERNIRRMADFVTILGFKGFAEATFDTLKITNLRELLSLDISKLKELGLGEETSNKFFNMINDIKTKKIPEHKIIGGLGFTSMSYTTWEYILNIFTLDEILNMYNRDKRLLYDSLIKIKGIGPKTIKTILEEFEFFEQDLYVINQMENVIPIKGSSVKDSVRFTNCRDSEFSEYLNSIGYDSDDRKGVTKSTNILIIPYEGFQGPSGKYDNAMANGFTEIIPLDKFKEMTGYKN